MKRWARERGLTLLITVGYWLAWLSVPFITVCLFFTPGLMGLAMTQLVFGVLVGPFLEVGLSMHEDAKEKEK